ncbi:hypothetical protein [Methylobacterium haplocladii]|uniref:hypothetical protein n=1 Tax=Methylobacterium haplocladii TaxID=1176176 RepID=UPI0011BE338D|nr:hypothetical protein [Methylobacterium haplocladii]
MSWPADLETALLELPPYLPAFEPAYWNDPGESLAARHVAPRSKGSARATLPITSEGAYRIISVESGLEYNWAIVIDGLLRPEYMVEQPEPICFYDIDGIEREHTFDFFIVTADSRRIYIQVKPLIFVERGFWDSTMKLIASQLCADHADEVLLLTEVGLHPDTVANAKLLRYVRRCPPLAAEDVVLDLLASAGATSTIEELVAASGLGGVAFVAALRLIDRGWLVVFEEGRIGYGSRVFLAAARFEHPQRVI